MKNYKYISAIVSMYLVLIITIMSVCTPDEYISQLEARKLQVMPTPKNLMNEEAELNGNKPSIKDYIFINGLGESWDKYFSDHIALRDIMVKTYTGIQSIINSKFINGIYLGRDGFFMTDDNPKLYSDEELKSRAEYFEAVYNDLDIQKMYMVNIPYKSDVYEKYMPIDGYKAVNKKYIDKLWEYIDNDKITKMDMNNIFTDKEDLYFKTDLHWNINGTWRAYEYIINEINKEFPNVGSAIKKDNYDVEVYEEYFIGTSGRKVEKLVDKMDTIEVVKIKNTEDYIVSIDGGIKTFYYDENLVKGGVNNEYAVYFGGDKAEVIIENTKANNDLSIVLLGDSMDNPLIPLLAPHFKKIYSYDLRHYKGNLRDTVNGIDADIFMFIGFSDNFLNQNSKLFNF